MKKICLMPAMTMLLAVTFFVFGGPSSALAAKAKFTATVVPAVLNLQVSPAGVVRGQRTVEVRISRERVGASAACNKIRTLEVLRSLNSLGEPVLNQYTPNPARCYFKTTQRVTPFPDEEIAGVCRGATGRRTLRADGLVTAWNGLPHAANGPDYLRDMHRKGGTGGPGPRSQARITFVANVECGAQGTASGMTPPPPHGDSRLCDLSGTWIGFTNSRSNRAEGWRFERIFSRSGSVTYRATHLSRDGRPTGNEGTMTQTASGDYLFYTILTGIPNSRGGYQNTTLKVYSEDPTCQKLTQGEMITSEQGRFRSAGTSWLERAGAQTPQRSRVGVPTRQVPGVYPARKAPALPGSSFKDKVPQSVPNPSWGK